ncbi:phage tail tape measure protein [Bradyrhizobium sp. th.b2]|uniref:phage tail tape measure protein n=1 Tax=Bradyrhizobium sp. th-b2 TaxID=172088 RepID=UPI0003FE6B19|nr:phage tail tape measure protein [Bradyrhizobium sp. th.b2]
MSDNNLDIRARLTGEDKLSPTVVKLLAKIKSLEEQMKKLGKAGSSIESIPMENYVKAANKMGRSLNGLTKKHYDWAKANGVHTERAQLSWGKLTNRIRDLKDQHEQLVNSHKRGSKTMAANIEKQLRNEYKNAVAFKYLYNKTNDDRLAMHRRVTEQLSNLEAAHLRNEERRQRTHVSNLSRMRRDAMRSMGMAANFGSSAAPYAAAAAAATGYAGVSAFRTRMKIDTAETNMRMFAEMSQEQVKEFRRSYGNRAAIRYGMAPDQMLDSFTEVRKAGIPQDKAQAVTDTILKAGAGLDLDLKETTRFATRLATLTQDMSNLNPEKLKKMLNSVAVAGIATAADPNEIIAANRRASGAFASSKLDPNELPAFTGPGISAGLPSSKTGTFIGFIVNELVGGKYARGQRAKDLGKAANMLGLGGRQAMSAKMAANPTETLLQIFDKMGTMSEEKQSQIATLLGMREWRDELQTFVQVRDDIRRTLKEIRDPKNADTLDKISDEKLKSLAGRWKSFVSAMTLVWESVGAGFEKAFTQISAFFTDYLGRIDTSKITNTVEAFTDGLVAGMGFNSWSDMLKAAFGDPTTAKGYAKEVFGFVKGFVGEISRAAKMIGGMMTAVFKAFGGKEGDPESWGKFTAQLIELVAALKAIGTVAGYLEGIVTFVKGIGGLLLKITGIPGILALLGVGAAAASDAAVSDSHIRRPGESVKDFRARESKLKELRNYKPSGDPLFQPTSFGGATDFSGRRRGTIDDLSENLNKFTGKVERAAFISNGPGGLQYAALGGGSGRGLVGSGGGGLVGGVPSLLKSTPGAALPDFGVGRAGSIIGRDKIPSIGGSSGGGLSRSGFDRVFAGTPLAGKYDQIVDAAKANGISPSLLAGVMAQESGKGKFLSGNNPGGIMDPATGWKTKMQFNSLDAGIDQTAKSVAKNWNAAGGDLGKMGSKYAPIGAANDPRGLNRHWVPGVQSFMNQMGDGSGAAAAAAGVTPGLADKLGLRGKANFMKGQYGGVGQNQQTIMTASGKKFTVNAAAAESFKGFVDELEASGYKVNSLGGFNMRQKRGSSGWSQHAYGNAIDINPGTNPQYGGTDMPDNVRDMAAKYGLSWGGDWSKRFRDPMHFEWNGTQPWKDVPSASDAIKNVPPVQSPASLGAGQMRGGTGGPVQIHINGSSHDPEALATLVQRRIDESMNWRTHDTASEYT